MNVHYKFLPITHEKSPTQKLQPMKDYVWGRKRSFIDDQNNHYPETKRADVISLELLENQVNQMNSSLQFCDDLLKMFDELILPAARLLDTVETKIKDYQLTHDQLPPVSLLQPIQSTANNIKVSGKKSKVVLSFKQPSSTPILFPNPPTKASNAISNLKEHKTIVYEEDDVLDWSHCSYNRSLQEKQAEEEAETDQEMIDYGKRVASKTVRTAVKAIQNMTWSISQRIERYKKSVNRLNVLNRHHKH